MPPPPALTPPAGPRSARASSSSYTLLDAGRGERLEQWGPFRLRRPDPRATMPRALSADEWAAIDAHYRGAAGRGRWDRLRDLPERWTIAHGGLTLVVKLAPYKHTGVFPEQVDHWRWLTRVASQAGRPLAILNLFAYTGAATMTLAKAGHHVTHVDASKPALAWARENAVANDLPADAIRWIQDDAVTFVRRELRRGRRYDAAIMDPPAFGRTPTGHIWRVGDDLPGLLADVVSALADPVFLLINDYSHDAEHERIAPLVESALNTSAVNMYAPGRIESGHLRLQRAADHRALDTGTFVRWHQPRLTSA